MTRKRTKAETLYSRMHDIMMEYDEMVSMLQQVQALIYATERGERVDWVSIHAQISKLHAFQETK